MGDVPRTCLPLILVGCTCLQSDIVCDTILEFTKLKARTDAVRHMCVKLQPLRGELRKRQQRRTDAGCFTAAASIQARYRGNKGRSDALVVRARKRAHYLLRCDHAATVLNDMLVVCRNRLAMSASVFALIAAARQAQQSQLKRHTAQVRPDVMPMRIPCNTLDTLSYICVMSNTDHHCSHCPRATCS